MSQSAQFRVGSSVWRLGTWAPSPSAERKDGSEQCGLTFPAYRATASGVRTDGMTAGHADHLVRITSPAP
jgi:hypothetical protein